MILYRGLLLCAALLAGPATADRINLPADMPASYPSECGSCHLPFPPSLLSADDWRKTMAGLERHFGTDASLEAKESQVISAWLTRHAGRRPASGEKTPRITTAAWFVREHDEVPARIWRDERIKSAANCAACHRGANQGRYGEGELDVPGLGRHHEGH